VARGAKRILRRIVTLKTCFSYKEKKNFFAVEPEDATRRLKSKIARRNAPVVSMRMGKNSADRDQKSLKGRDLGGRTEAWLVLRNAKDSAAENRGGVKQ